MSSARVTSARWWTENRSTGEITIAQFPNWPLFAIGAAWLIGLLADEDSAMNDLAGSASTALWLFWGADELVRGVNPWRRVLGSMVIVWQIASLAT